MSLAPASASPITGGLSRWRDVLEEHYLRLGLASRRLRFLAPMADAGLKKIAEKADPVSVIGIEVDGRIRGVLEIFPLANGHAEIGMSVEDAYQGRGYGRHLFRAGLQEAQRHGISTADFYFASGNTGIRRLLRSAEAEVTHSQYGDVYATVNIAKTLSQ